MREIKFRAWNIQENRWMTADEILERVLVNPAWDGKHFQIDEKLMNGLSQDIGYGFDLMQYTGLKDKNDVEIYEGDVVQILLPHESFIVEWDEIGTGYLFHHTEDTKRTHGIDYYEFEDKSGSLGFEVIGNIYEHPHLIGGEWEGMKDA